MQATDTTPKELAEAIMVFWARVMRGHEGAVFELFAELGVTVTQVKTLQVLNNCVDELTVKDLADRLKLSLPSASRTAEGLLQRGWVERREDEHDRRMKRLRITDAGRQVAQQITSTRLAGLEDFAASLTAGQRAALVGVLTAIREENAS